MHSELNLLKSWGWSDQSSSPPIAAYIHIPFCRHRCGYCNFSLLANRDDLFERFLDGLAIELCELQKPRPVETLFLGGGTPSILPTSLMRKLLELLRHWLPLSQDGEWSIEANPLDIHQDSLRLWKDFGINRISIGGQSFHPAKLKRLERDHSPDELKHAIDVARSLMDSVSLDLIFAAPDETPELWRNDLRQAIQSGANHLSTYGLTYEKGARFWGERERQIIKPVDEDSELEMYLDAIDTLTSNGFTHYEISNFARPDHACRHNQAYWNGDSWWAFGPSAARYIGGVRSVNHRGTLEYLRRLESDCSPVVEREELTLDQQWRERFVFGMRQLRGVAWKTWQTHVPEFVRASIDAKIAEHIEHGWLQEIEDHVRLTRKGLVVSDSLWPEYLD
ncbi:MAG: radical SAM family heme chaperone HemW [Planctomycetes bacterium]|nr:radical SAM family heme chaperone HemW [Planctomycetota bacterium]